MRHQINLALVAITMALASCAIASHSQAQTTTLQQLLDGGSIVVDDSVFFNFSFLGDDGTQTIDASAIDVSGIETAGGAGLEFVGNGELDLGPGSDSIAFGIGYDALFGQAQQFGEINLDSGNPIAGDEGLINVTHAIFSGAPLLDLEAQVDPVFGINDTVVLARLSNPATSFSAETNVTLFADPDQNVSLGSFRTTTSSIPEPSSAIVLSLIGTTFLIRRKRSS